mmetsp:Transcript_53280/g.102993  ORF Transcript_53280/g.102993 Transcript_53280/m.102993 type:complete len:180 (+) Transcript_53280:91-630(+)
MAFVNRLRSVIVAAAFSTGVLQSASASEVLDQALNTADAMRSQEAFFSSTKETGFLSPEAPLHSESDEAVSLIEEDAKEVVLKASEEPEVLPEVREDEHEHAEELSFIEQDEAEDSTYYEEEYDGDEEEQYGEEEEDLESYEDGEHVEEVHMNEEVEAMQKKESSEAVDEEVEAMLKKM